ncbi:SdrD B-like domain-containing protein [Kibdelosporangium aridum]|uniref:LPXTG-motif cell wall anchor domain-containing protein n=1 Tax=Kibdelosporangium aridum TaxID=2030 RepID=A0A1W2D7E6_KIBAR|nr:SdrD B-like domain-containing protein [Kibdelosporangium aridum]SMC93164.1 LPXTG-motif cell wall anchor domain-containing protein [Kibdelosporangium aridum]
MSRVAGLVAAGSLVLAGLAVPTTATASPSDGTLTVRLVRDVNGNGSYDPALEVGVPGIPVTVTDPAGGTATGTTGPDGVVKVDLGPVTGGGYRVDASIPSTMPHLRPAPTGNGLSGLTEFVSGPNPSITMGVWNPAGYCQANPTLATACQRNIAKTGNDPAARSLMTFPFTARGNAPAPTAIAKQGDTGSVFGLAYRKQDKRLFSGAFAKRLAPYGPGGPGAIYVTTPAGVTSQFATVPNAGSTQHSDSHDGSFFSVPGKESLGDLEMSEDGTALYTVNLADKKLYVFDATVPTASAPVGAYDIPATGCANAADWRPSALAAHDGVLYVGGVCAGQDLKALVLPFQKGTFGAPALTKALGTGWHAWLDRWGLKQITATGADVAYAQPFLTNMAVESNGDMVLALRDRFGDQLGHQTPAPNGNNAYNAVVAGTLDRVCKQECANTFKDTKTGMGALAMVPGSAKMPATTLGGASWVDRAAGAVGGTFQIADQEGWGKANSLADLEALCDLAPLQLGSRVWFDADKDGVQDGTEPPLQGVKVTATPCAGGAALPAQTTNSKGEYAFSAGVLPDTCYNVKFDFTGAVTTGLPGAPPGSSLKWTVKQAGANKSADSNVDPASGLATVTTGSAGSVDTTIDAGVIAPTSTLGDMVWMDNNRNGVFDSGEPGVPGVTVTAGSFKAVTGQDGKYVLGGLPDGTYQVCFTGWPAGYLPTIANQGSDSTDSDADPGSGCAPPVTVGPAKREDLTIDFGVRPPNKVGDLVWSDTNRNGLFDADEPPVPGVTVTVGSLTTVTGLDGKYVFDKLPDGKHTVCFDLKNLPAAFLDFQPTKANQGDDALDSDVDMATGCAQLITLDAGNAENFAVDAGLVPPVNRIGDFVWSDLNRDGRQDPGEPGLAGVQVTLGTQKVFTAADGRYMFEGMPDGKYAVCFGKHADFDFVTPNTGDDSKNSDADPKTGCAPEVSVGPGTRSVLSVDAGFSAPPQSIGDFVWSDANRNGLFDTGEPGVAGVTVTVGTMKTTTGPDGKYLFTGLPEGDHTVCFTAPGDLQMTKPNAGDDGLDSDADPASGCTSPVRLGPGSRSVLTVDAGLSSPVNRIGDFVWSDLNRNGRFDSGEPGVPGVTVTAGTLQTTTGADGKYLLSDVPDGKYRVCFAVNGFKLGAGVDSTGCAPEVSVGPGNRSVLTVDVGLLSAPNKVGDLVWRDTNRNGLYESGEPGMPGITVTTGNLTTVTGANGEYQFPELGDGKHAVCFVLKDDLQLTKPFAGSADKDSNADPSSKCAPAVTLGPSNREDLTVDAGLMSPVNRIGGFLWLDRNRNGAADQGELPAPGVTVKAGSLTTVTDASGKYLFSDLPDGTHQVCFGAHQDFTAACAADVVLGVGKREFLSVDAGLVAPPNQIGDLVWLDSNRNGSLDADESGLPGITVYAGSLKTVTDAAGKYLFNDLPDGSYRVCFALPDNYLYTQADGCAETVTLGPGNRSVMSLDAGLRLPNQLGGLVWYDTNGNGIPDAGEGGVAGVEVTVGSHKVVTGPDGRYLVEGLPDGRYVACFARFGEYQAVAIDPSTWCTAPTRLYAGKWEDLSLNAGLVSPRNRIGDFVWIDKSRDGLQDPAEAGAANVTLVLLEDGQEVAKTVTDKNGRYLFDGLSDGNYVVCLPRSELKGHSIATRDAGEDTRDSDVDTTSGCSKPVHVGSSKREVLTADIGLLPPKALAHTGASIGWLVTGGVGVLAIGLLLLLYRRRKA